MIGTLLGNRYELLEKIGEGGMAEVFKARCRLLNRYVAVKILKKEFSKDLQFVEKFKIEATAAASLSDNNIVNVYDVGSENDINYIVMEYVKGKTLKQIIREQNRLTYTAAVNIAIQIAKGLECAHRNNIIHRDIKPHNILVTDEGVVKVTDFGIAKASNSVTITNTDKVLGSAHYFSPEQAKGRVVDCTTDIYSLGIVIYEMVTGKVPYDAESPVSVALKHIQEPVIPPKQLNNNIPDSLNKLILKAIEKEPIRRYSNIKEMLNDLKKIQNNEDIDVTYNDFNDTNDRTRVMNPVIVDDGNDKDEYDEYDDNEVPFKKKKIIIGVAIAILVLIIGGFSGYFLFNKLASPGKDSSATVEVPSIVGLDKDKAKSVLQEKKLQFTIGGTEPSDKPEGTVISCMPKEGTKIKINEEVRVIISDGKPMSTVPDLKDIDIEVAKDIISRKGLGLGEVTYEYSDNIDKNCVIRQSPEKGSKIKPDTKVDLVISMGTKEKYSTVPSLDGKTLDEAISLLENSNLKLGNRKSVETFKEELDGKVLSQSIEEGTQVKEGSSVSVSYYVYKEKNENEMSKGEKDENEKVTDEEKLKEDKKDQELKEDKETSTNEDNSKNVDNSKNTEEEVKDANKNNKQD